MKDAQNFIHAKNNKQKNPMLCFLPSITIVRFVISA